MSHTLSEIDRMIKERFESLYDLNKKWMTKEQFEWFIDYKLNRENIGDVRFDAEFLVSSVPHILEKKVLDVGCGPGDLVVNLARKNINIVGIDMSEDDIEIARLKSLKYNLKSDICQVQNGAKIPYPDESFDVVTCIEVLEHTGKYYIDVLKEIFRVLKKKGVLYLTIPNKLCPYDTHLYTWIPHWLPKWIRIPYLNKIRGEKAKKENYLLDYNFFSSREIKNILKSFSNKIDVNEKYLKYKFKNLDDNRDIKSLIKYIVKKFTKIKSFNYLLIKFIIVFYFLQSIKILVEKE